MCQGQAAAPAPPPAVLLSVPTSPTLPSSRPHGDPRTADRDPHSVLMSPGVASRRWAQMWLEAAACEYGCATRTLFENGFQGCN